MNKSVFKSILHNIGVVAVGFIFAFIGVGMDKLFGLSAFHSNYVVALGSVLIAIGFLLRVWAAYLFYEQRVIRLFTQAHLITDGPYRFTRHPLYLGGNVFIMLGAALVLGTPGGVILTVLHWPLVMNPMAKREERQLDQTFGDEWRACAKRTRRWI